MQQLKMERGGPRRSSMGPTEGLPAVTYGNVIVFAICINYMIGTGVFSLPAAFYESGIPVMGALVCMGAFVSLIAAYYTLETMARMDGVSNTRNTTVVVTSATASTDTMASSASVLEQNPPSDSDDDGALPEEQRALAGGGGEAPRHEITFRKFAMVALCERFGGAPGKWFMEATITLYCWGVMWAYVVSFSTTLTTIYFLYFNSDQPSCDPFGSHPTAVCKNAYYTCAAIFAALVIPLTLVDLQHQRHVQLGLTAYRVVAFFVMLATCARGIDGDKDAARTNWEYEIRPHFSGFATAFTSTVVALNFQKNLPDILHPARDKKGAKRIVLYAILFTLVFYLTLGIVVAVFLGKSANTLVTLNWKDYTGCGSTGWEPCGRNAGGVIVQLIVLLFPVLDMANVFPLVAITTANNLLQSIPSQYLEGRSLRANKVLTRLAIVIPPFALGLSVGSISIIIKVAGLFAFFLELIIPCGLQILSVRECMRLYPKCTHRQRYWTPFSAWHSALWVAAAILLYSFGAFVVALVLVIKPDAM